jgi:hypothetical protein
MHNKRGSLEGMEGFQHASRAAGATMHDANQYMNNNNPSSIERIMNECYYQMRHSTMMQTNETYDCLSHDVVISCAN